jgi:hypothetical protein
MDLYEVVVVRYAQPCHLKSWRDVPARYTQVGTPLRELVQPLASAWARAFNQAELTRPYGVWAIMRRQDNDA